jgi:hypothetical protein
VFGKAGAEIGLAAVGLPLLLNRFGDIIDALGSLEAALAIIAADNAALASRLASVLEANEGDIGKALAALSESDREELGREFDHNRGFTHISIDADPLKVSVRSGNAKSNRRAGRSELVQLQDRAGTNPQFEIGSGEFPGSASDFLP